MARLTQAGVVPLMPPAGMVTPLWLDASRDLRLAPASEEAEQRPIPDAVRR